MRIRVWKDINLQADVSTGSARMLLFDVIMDHHAVLPDAIKVEVWHQ